MKRTLSLILAVVMVALMIPFAAIVTSAADDASSEIVLPDGWVMTADDGDANKNYQNEHGLVLYGDSQAIGMTTKVGIGQKRVYALEFGVPTKINILNWSWEANQPAADTAFQQNFTAGKGGNETMLCVLGGPDQQVTDGASFGMKGSNSATGGSWFNASGTGYIRKAGSDTYSKHGIARFTVGNALKLLQNNDWRTVEETLYDGACTDNGMKLAMYVEIDENDYVTGAYIQIVTVDANGNFKQETVLYYANGTGYKVSCDGYLAIGHSGWGGNCALMVKSVNIYAGTATNMGETLHSANFAKKAADPADTVAATELTKGEASYNEVAEGIRFTTTVDADDFQTLTDLCDEGKVDKIEFGTLITTEAWADAAGAVTFAALDTAVGDSGKTAYVAVMATVGDFYDGLNTFAGSIGNAKAERTYVAVGFAKVTIGEDVIYVYSAATTATLASVQG